MPDHARKTPGGDIQPAMLQGSGRADVRSVAAAKGCLTPAMFADRFEGASKALWCIAAAVVGDRCAADDVVQESAMIALGKLEQFEPDSNFLAWMGRIVRYVALNHGRRRAGQRPVDPETLDLDPTPNRRRGQPDHDEHRRAINGFGLPVAEQLAFDDQMLAALNSLDPSARACLLLRVVMNMPYRDIARALDMAEGTAMSHVHRSRMALRDRLSNAVSSSERADGGAHADK